jgi:L-ascorbate metabolism protein UlaG (beta-lactamase superfamily)
VALTDTIETQAGPLKITPIFHASVMLQAGGKVIHIDPYSEGNYAGLPAADLVLITHVHGDHNDPKALALVRQPSTLIYAGANVAKTIDGAKVMANGDVVNWGDFKIEAVPMYNLVRGPSAGTFFHPKGLGNGYIISYGGKRIYFSGDTEATPEFRALKHIDVAFVCMNLPYTMTAAEAGDGVKAMHPAIVYPYHYRNGDKTLQDLAIFQKALDGSHVDVRLRNWYPAKN